ncbi:tumor necrosis factor receptor superfamily member 27 [Ctenopharyngodon idella]|uniref:tumor necrosis factor receptor superfamily member 27 n=1 Tax=Ctenopharyngodon idella TaxID=7959 RepID=UPI002231D65A|nr:tumor necrosis factor receptor superfamily member 27 [Ctenopharyngodon idella]XP_051748900.1 tumor necrosis factor receptor superfamily member 27 [Ctenopharyngodon idella]
MDCSIDEYYHNGQCHKCPQCPPGQELKEDCGYGVGVSAVCGVCDVRWFKEDSGSQPCALCQNCRRLNRHQIKHCTHTDNAVCGNCLPGFYSKMRLDGLEDLECLPCGPAPFRNIQCTRGEGIGVTKVQTSAPPIQNTSSIVTACAATAVLTAVLFAIVCVTYQTRSSLRKTCKRCLSPVSNSHHDSDTASVPMTTLHTMMKNTDVDRSNTCLPLKDPCMFDDITTTMTSDLGLHGCEVLPLVRSSACTDPATGVITQPTETPDVSSSESVLSNNHAILTLVGGQFTVRPCCAVEQRTAWGLHAPVECTELDLQHLSITPEIETFRTSDIISRNIPACMGSDSTLPSGLMLRDLERERREGGKGHLLM